MKITAKIVIQVSEIQLQTRRLAEIDVDYAFGEGLIGDREALIVVTEGERAAASCRSSSRRKSRLLPPAQAGPTSTTAPVTSMGFMRSSNGGRDWCRKHGPASETR